MNTNVCIYCGKIFMAYNKGYVCKECQKKDDEFFARILDYLNKYPNSNALQIAESLEVSPLEIVRFINEGRLQIKKGEFKKI